MPSATGTTMEVIPMLSEAEATEGDRGLDATKYRPRRHKSISNPRQAGFLRKSGMGDEEAA